MWKKLKQTMKKMFGVVKNMSRSGVLPETISEESLQKFESALNSSANSDIQLQINGEWISKSLVEAISVDNCQQKLLKLCQQTEAHRLEHIFPEDIHNQMDILWSGCYSEVLRIRNLNGEDIILKISLINRLDKEGTVIQNAAAILSDVINSKRLSDLKAIPYEMADNYCENFANVKSFLFVWSSELVFNKSEFKGKTDPNAKYDYFISHQSFGGKQLDSVKSLSPTKALSLVLQLIASLAVAEDALKFEHRDLHLSNLLIKKSDEKCLNYSIGGMKFRLKLYGIKLVIIDTTFSRTQIKVINQEEEEEEHYFFNDLSSLNLEDYQNHELKKVYLRQIQTTGNNWKQFYPKTNIIWSTYCVNRICKMVDNWSKEYSIPSNSIYSHHLSQLKQIKLKISHSNSAKDFASFCQLI